jgi:hypothetical protein
MAIEREYSGPELFGVKENMDSELLVRNRLQIELAMRWAKDLVHRNEEISAWSKKYSEKFSEILLREQNADAELTKKLGDSSFRESFLEKIEEELYKDEPDVRINDKDEVELDQAA